MTNTIRRELKFAQSPETVWRALTDSEVLAEWMYPNDFEPRVGHRFIFRVPPSRGSKTASSSTASSSSVFHRASSSSRGLSEIFWIHA